MNNTDLHQLSGAYALDALDDVERARYENHLDSCDACRAEVDSFLATAAALGAVDEVEPDASLRTAVLDEVDRTRQLSPRVSRRPRNLTRLLSVAAGILAVAVVGLSVVTASLAGRVDQLDRLAGPVTEVLRAPDTVSLAETTTDDGGLVRVLAAPSTGSAVLVTDDLATVGDDSDYQVWLIDEDGNPTSAGLLELDAGGDADQVLAGALEETTTIGVSVEPAGGSDAPTTTPVALLEL